MKLTRYDKPIGGAKAAPLFVEEYEPELIGQHSRICPMLMLAGKHGVPKRTYYTRIHRGMAPMLAATMPSQSHSEVAKRQVQIQRGGRHSFLADEAQ